MDTNTAVYLYSFGIQYISQEVLSKIKDKSMTHNIFKIQSDDSIICGFYCIAFIEYMTEYMNIYLLIEIKVNDLMREKHKKMCKALNYFELFLVLISAVSGCLSISAFPSLIGVLVGIVSSTKIRAIPTGVHQLSRKNKNDKIVLLPKIS